MFRIPPQKWGVTWDDLDSLGSEAADRFYARDTPNVYAVVKEVIAPRCRRRHVSYSILRNPAGLTCNTFVSHAWSESYFQFVEDIRVYGPDIQDRVFWICFTSLPQTWPAENLKVLLGVTPHLSPFSKAIDNCDDFWIVRNANSNMFLRLWCLAELSFASEQNRKAKVRSWACSCGRLPT